ncbi:MAG TPA: hypothetical protein VJM08_07850, partial [Anaerolineales bacterium]|nr:hypothetical protein [Anaerolineales bacterium]
MISYEPLYDRFIFSVSSDGVAAPSAMATGVYNGTASLDLGRRGLLKGPLYLDGRVDEAVIFKCVLTADERGWLYNNGAGRAYAALGSATTYTYGSAAHKHAVTALSTGESYTYDANGNMTQRVEG